MRIAVTYGEKGLVFGHFGHTETFRIYDINEQNMVSSISMLNTNGVTCCALSELLKDNGVNVLICGGIGPNAISRLTSLDIKVVNGVEGDCDVAVAKFLANQLDFSLEANCKHEQSQIKRHSCHSHHEDCHECD